MKQREIKHSKTKQREFELTKLSRGNTKARS